MTEHNTVGILGAGTWGTALARLLAGTGKRVTVWSHSTERAYTLSQTRRHSDLPEVVLPDGIEFTNDIRLACTGMDAVVFAVASPHIRTVAHQAAAYIPEGQLVITVAKGIEPDTLLTMSEVLEQELACSTPRVAALSGPSHAEEVARDLPTVVVAASEDRVAAEYVQRLFSTSVMRVYTNCDIRGVELCGALKNIIALAAGISRGLGYGDNAKAALITRGLSELARLGSRLGCTPETFNGLAGVGDLIVTCTSEHSRNNRCGYLIGRGLSAPEAVERIGMAVEGLNALDAAMELARQNNVEIPIISAVNDIVRGAAAPADAVNELFARDLTSEFGLYL